MLADRAIVPFVRLTLAKPAPAPTYDATQPVAGAGAPPLTGRAKGLAKLEQYAAYYQAEKERGRWA